MSKSQTTQLVNERNALRAACIEASKRIRAHRKGFHKWECACTDCEVVMQIERALGNEPPGPASDDPSPPEPIGATP